MPSVHATDSLRARYVNECFLRVLGRGKHIFKVKGLGAFDHAFLKRSKYDKPLEC